MDDASLFSHRVELDPVSDGDLVSELVRGALEQAPPQVARKEARSSRSLGPDRDFLSQDLEDDPDER
jgi:hypothetical protein